MATGFGAWERLKEKMSNITVIIAGPLSTLRDTVAGLINEAFTPGMISKISSWAMDIAVTLSEWVQDWGQTLIGDLRAIVNKDITLGQALKIWADSALNEITFLWQEHVQPWLQAMMDEFQKHREQLRQFLVDMFTELGKAAAVAFEKNVIPKITSSGGMFTNFFEIFTDRAQGLAPLTHDFPVSTPPSALIPDDLGNMGLPDNVLHGLVDYPDFANAASAVGPAQNITFHINGAADPMAVANEVSRLQQQAALTRTPLGRY
jgi:hypothetical protein